MSRDATNADVNEEITKDSETKVPRNLEAEAIEKARLKSELRKEKDKVRQGQVGGPDDITDPPTKRSA